MMRSCTLTNCSPMMWRFTSGSRTCSRALRNSSSHSSMRTSAEAGEGVARRNPFRLRASGRYPRRLRARARSPARRRHSVNATVESTPPLTKKNTLRPPARRQSLLRSGRCARPRFQSFAQPQMSKTKFSRIRAPSRGVDHFGMELDAVEVPRADLRWPPWRRWTWSPERGNRRAAPPPDRDATSRSADDRATPAQQLRIGVRSDREWPGRTRPCRPCAPRRPAAARSAAGRSRCPAPECRAVRTAGSMVGLESS